jgi:hypothetical protein
MPKKVTTKTTARNKPGPKVPDERQVPIRLSVDESLKESLQDISDNWGISVSEIIRNSIHYVVNLDIANQRDVLFPLKKR